MLTCEDCKDPVKTENCKKCYKCEDALFCECTFCPTREAQQNTIFCALCTIINDERLEEKNRKFAPYFQKEFGNTYGDINTIELYFKTEIFCRADGNKDDNYLAGFFSGEFKGRRYGFGYASFGPNMDKPETRKWVETLKTPTVKEEHPFMEEFFDGDEALQEVKNTDSYKRGFADGVVFGFRIIFNKILYYKKLEKQYGTNFDGKTYYKLDDFREGFSLKEGETQEDYDKWCEERRRRPLGI